MSNGFLTRYDFDARKRFYVMRETRINPAKFVVSARCHALCRAPVFFSSGYAKSELDELLRSVRALLSSAVGD
jgi:hypothetical protein